jgi:hypothetical protein
VLISASGRFLNKYAIKFLTIFLPEAAPRRLLSITNAPRRKTGASKMFNFIGKVVVGTAIGYGLVAVADKIERAALRRQIVKHSFQASNQDPTGGTICEQVARAERLCAKL